MTTLAPVLPVPSTAPAPLIERAVELEALAAAIRRLERGTGGVVVLEAAAGLGKTALLDQAAGLAGTRCLLRRAAPGPLERQFCFGLVRALLEAPAREHPQDGAATMAGDLLLSRSTPACDATMLIAHSVLWLCAGLGPLALFVDDAQWADQPSLDVLAYLARRIDDLPLLLVVASRAPLPLRGATVLRPQPLTLAGSAHIIRRTDPFATDDECAELHEAAQGNPWLLTSGNEGVRHKLMELSPRDRAVAEALAVVGDGAEPYVVAAVAGVPLAELGAARDTLTADGLLRGTWFAHDLIADAISAELPHAQRERLHRHAADALRDEPALAASHLLATGPRADPEVSELLQRAAAGATPRAAAAYLDRALHERAPGDDRSALLAQLANATFDAGLPEARRRLRDALHEVRGRGRADVLTRLAALNLADADDRHLPELFDRELERETDPATRAAVAAASLDALIIQPGRQAERARRVSTLDTTDPLLTRVLLAHRAWIGLERGTPTAAECAALALHALDGVHLLEEAQRRCAYVIAVRTLVLTDDLQAPAKIAELLAEADERGSVRLRVAAERYAAELALRLGRVADAETHARLALDLVPEDVNAFTGGALEALVVALAERGAFAEAHALLQRYPVEGTAPWEIGMRHARARLWLAEGEYERAYADAAEAGRLRHEQGRVNPSLAPWRVTASLALSHLGRRDDAAALARTDLDLAERFGAPRPIAAALHALAIATPDTAAHAQRALEIAPDGLEAVRARIELGEKDGLRRALADADAAGATLLADRARRELFASGARPRHAALEGPEALTPRQRQLCELAAAGKSNRVIAQELFLSIKTVETHLAAAYRKLGVNTRAELQL